MSDQQSNNPESADNTPDRAGATEAEAGGDFDAIGAAAELDAILGGPEPEPVRESEKSGQSYAEILETEVEELTALIAEKEAALAAAEDELEKSKMRIEREAKKVLEQRSRKILLGFLEVLDDLDRALGAAREVDHNPAVIDGIELVRKSFLTALASFGVGHQPALGHTFDPERHDAVSMISDPEKDGEVVAVVREGYLIGDETLRPAGVVVAKK